MLHQERSGSTVRNDVPLGMRWAEGPEHQKTKGLRVRSSSTEGASCDSLQRMEAQDAMVRWNRSGSTEGAT